MNDYQIYLNAVFAAIDQAILDYELASLAIADAAIARAEARMHAADDDPPSQTDDV